MVKKTSPKKTISRYSFTQTNDDLKHSILLVSLFINLIVLVTWLVVRLDNTYLSQLTWLVK